MTQSNKLVIPYQFLGFNEIIEMSKKYWRKYADMKKEATGAVASYCFSKRFFHNDKPIDVPVEISFHWYCRNKRMDPDNISVAKKFVIDGLVYAQVLSDDGWNQVSGFSDDFYIDRENPRVEVVITQKPTTSRATRDRLP